MATRIETVNLRKIELFRGLSAEQLDHLAQRIYCRVYPSGTNLIIAEQPGEVVYVLLYGTVKIHVEQVNGNDVVLSILGTGDIVGEISLIDSAGRSASVVTLEESQILWMGGETFQECLQTMPALSKNLARILAGRLRLANELIQALASLDVNGRVARQILAFADRYGMQQADGVVIPVRLTQGDEAARVGASRKRVNQAMVLFKQQGLVALDEKGWIVMRDRSGLENYCR